MLTSSFAGGVWYIGSTLVHALETVNAKIRLLSQIRVHGEDRSCNLEGSRIQLWFSTTAIVAGR